MQPDVVIIGSGIGGATYAAALAPMGLRILILERGKHLSGDGKDRNAKAIFADGYFRSAEQWLDGAGAPFNPGNYYLVGGNSKLYGASLVRFREADFQPRQHPGGRSGGWPIPYWDLEPYYCAAESLYRVRGISGPNVDVTEPERSKDYDFPPVAHEPDIAWLQARLAAQGLSPTTIPLGIDLDAWLAGGETPWDAFPNTGKGKMDAETCALAEALKYPNVTLKTDCQVRQLTLGDDKRIKQVIVQTPTGVEHISAKTFVLAAGAVQSAALLLKSATPGMPTGLANSSDQVGRNFMNHNASAIMALHPFRMNRALYQKTLMINDFYDNGPTDVGPLGNIQMLGKISGDILRASTPWLSVAADWIANRSFDFYAMSEDLPDPDSRITVQGDQIVLNWKRTNWHAHVGLVRAFRRVLKQAGFPIVLSKAFDHKTPSHQCGTARLGLDPKSSVVNSFGQSHDHANLIISDASILPTSAAMNPALTIAALSLRSAEALSRGRIGQ